MLADRGRRTSRLRVSHAFHSPLMEPMLEEFRSVVAGFDPAAPAVPVVSSLTGDLAGAEELCDPGYWVRHVREPVRFADAVTTLTGRGAATFVEIGPGGVLSAIAQDSLPGSGTAVTVPVLRGDRSEDVAVVTALAALHVRGVRADWAAVFDGTGVTRVDLPTYAFQHRRYWPGAGAARGDVRSAGLGAAGHPLLGAAVAFPDGAGALLTGRLSASAQPWLADHTVAGTVVLPGTALLELAVRAGDEVGCTAVEELTLGAPLTLPTGGTVAVQVRAGADDGSGRRPVTVHARPGDTGEWTEHATGTLTTAAPEPVRFDATTWPPAGAAELDVEGCYERFADAGFGYGPVFRGLTAAWQDGDTVYGEVALPEQADGAADDAARFGLHPALLDAALHAALLTGDGTGGLPWAWEDVTLHATGATALRVRLEPADGGGLTVAVADPGGQPVATAGRLLARPVDPAALGTGAAVRDALFRLDWTPVTPSAGAETVPFAVLGAAGDPVTDALADGRTRYDSLDALLADAADAAVTGAGVAPVPATVLAAVPAVPAADTPRDVRSRVDATSTCSSGGRPRTGSPGPGSCSSPAAPSRPATSPSISPPPRCGGWSAPRRPRTPVRSACSTSTRPPTPPRPVTWPAHRPSTSRSSPSAAARSSPPA
ncbi:Malonyl CoA-acyl carrier protein transacylase [Pseudonocardia sp. Ae168_Ps1]|nr:Malonyl CoA-acyl carrier protein transacylase [Pseudonocardia sp. Ae150A_Ps1]OLL77652.1 Malonyl CoA-acyl carrier protein transacylase [Pseudonocardia sp. Ae168_Ps1]OLL88224.1 Malonyl CoA-acyl carrier protein transacylase [Pseudonocardia sp. Ae263_Ps1]OLL91745.1 Malonyl CoA-acyl carrier protein transacylase [Pseudonocardia sp. Ae356_Ps1]